MWGPELSRRPLPVWGPTRSSPAAWGPELSYPCDTSYPCGPELSRHCLTFWQLLSRSPPPSLHETPWDFSTANVSPPRVASAHSVIPRAALLSWRKGWHPPTSRRRARRPPLQCCCFVVSMAPWNLVCEGTELVSTVSVAQLVHTTNSLEHCDRSIYIDVA